MKKLIYSVLLTFCFSLVLLISCTEDEINTINEIIGPEGGSITSSDGRLTLDIPAGALDEDTEISIRKATRGELPPEFDGIETDTQYELLPDGLEFNIPIDVELITDQDVFKEDGNITNDVSFLLTSLDGELELLKDLRSTINADDNTVTEFGKLEHFSFIIKIFKERIINVVFSLVINNVPDAVEINQVFTVNTKVRALNANALGSVLNEFSGSYKDCSLPRIFSVIAPLEEDLSPEAADSPNDLELKGSYEYVCESEKSDFGIYCTTVKIFLEVEPVILTTKINPNIFDKEITLTKTIQCLAELPPTPTPPPPPLTTPTPTPSHTPTPTPTPTPTQVGCADISNIDFDALIESLAGQTSQQVFITPNACDMSRVTITNDNNGVVVTDDVPDGSGGGFPTLTGPAISENPAQDPSGVLCDLNAFGRDDVAGGNDVGIQALGQFVVTPQGAILFRFFQVSYGIDTPVQDWFGDPFIINCEPDP